MINEAELMELAKKFDRPGVRVIGTVPENIRLSEVVGIQEHNDRTTRLTIRRGETLFLCWVNSPEAQETILRLKKEISGRKNWSDRWEPWEVLGSAHPNDLIDRLIRSRLKNKQEIDEYDKENNSDPEIA